MAQQKPPNLDLQGPGKQPPKVLILGASCRPFAQSAKKAGFQVTAVDQFADWDTRKVAKAISVSNYPGDFESVIRELKSDCFAFSGGLENYPELISSIEKSICLLGNSASTLSGLLNKPRLFRWLQTTGIQLPPFILAGQPIPAKFQDRSWVRKKIHSAGGQCIEFVQDLPAAATELSTDFYLQQWIDGEPCSASLVAFKKDGQHEVAMLGFGQQLAGKPELHASGFSYCGSIYPSPIDSSASEEVINLGKRLAAEYRMKGLFNIDFIRSGKRLFFLEVNPRYSASMELIERLMPINLFLIHYLSCLTFGVKSLALTDVLELLKKELRKLDFSKAESPVATVGKAVWYCDRNVTVDAEFSHDAIGMRDEWGWPLIADIPPPATNLVSGAPAFTVFARANDSATVDDLLVKTATMLGSRLKSRD